MYQIKISKKSNISGGSPEARKEGIYCNNNLHSYYTIKFEYNEQKPGIEPGMRGIYEKYIYGNFPLHFWCLENYKSKIEENKQTH